MKRIILMGLVVLSGNFIQASELASTESDKNAFAEMVVDLVYAKRAEFDALFDKLIGFYREKGPFDVDSITSTEQLRQRTKDYILLGDFLTHEASRIIEKNKFYDDKDNPEMATIERIFANALIHRQIQAKIVAAFVYADRSYKMVECEPIGMLMDLLEKAVDNPSKSNDANLVFYFSHCSRSGIISSDLREIKDDKGVTLYDHFEQKAPRNGAVARVYEIFKTFGSAQVPTSGLSTDNSRAAVSGAGSVSGLPGSTNPSMGGQQLPPASNNIQQGGSQGKPGSPNQSLVHAQPNGWRSYLTPRNLLIGGGLLCIGALLYLRYMTESTQLQDEQIAIQTC